MTGRLASAAVVAGLVLVACATPSDPGAESPRGTSSDPGSASPRASGVATPATGSPAAIAEGPPALELELVIDGLAAPIGATGTPEGWLLVNEQDGRVVAVNPADGRAEVVLDIADRVTGGGEQGLLGLAIHPDWPEVGRAFIHYSDASGDTVLAEFAGTPGGPDSPPTFDAASERVLLQEDQPYPNHNGGQLAFGPDGHLYMALGDGGSAGDPHGHGQNPETRLGSILRLDVSAPGSATAPSDNPFASGDGGAPEVFLYGLRNPWRFSFDAETGLLWIADVGQDAYEEVNRVDPLTQAGANLGWNAMEATQCFAAADCSSEGLTLPLAEYGRDLGCSITGGYVYRGDAIPPLRGWYTFSDLCGGRIFAVASDAEPQAEGAIPPVVLLDSGRSITAFGESSDGELYVTDLAGGLYRLVAAP